MRIAYHAARDIVEHARRAAPDEACGLLAGKHGCISRALRLRNMAGSPQTRFELDPNEQIQALKSLDAASLDWIGIYHSHPRAAPLPSPADLAEASDSRLLHLIVSLERPKARLKLWRINGDSAQALELSFADHAHDEECPPFSPAQRIALVAVSLASLLLLLIVAIALLPPAP